MVKGYFSKAKRSKTKACHPAIKAKFAVPAFSFSPGNVTVFTSSKPEIVNIIWLYLYVWLNLRRLALRLLRRFAALQLPLFFGYDDDCAESCVQIIH